MNTSCLKENELEEEWILWGEYSFSLEGFLYLYRDEQSFKKEYPHVPIRKDLKNEKLRLEIYI